MPTRNVSLTKELDQFVAAKVEAGLYANAAKSCARHCAYWSGTNANTRRSWPYFAPQSIRASPVESQIPAFFRAFAGNMIFRRETCDDAAS